MKKQKEEPRPEFIPIGTLIVFITYAILTAVFLLLLNRQTESPFSVAEFGVALVIAIFLTGALLVVRSLIKSNPFEGLALGAVLIIIVIAALLVKFKGPYTYAFAAVGTLVAIIYLGYYFWKARTSN